MKLRLLFIFIAVSMLSSNASFAQLTIDVTPPNNNPTHLVQNVLLGQGVTATNINFVGSGLAIGFFDGTNSNLGIDSGLVISSGDVTDAVGPNTSGSTTTSHNLPGDPLLNSLSSSTTNDAAVLSFDFIPSSDTIKFRFVFGSEEYPEFVGAGFNDVFGFFISGPIPGGGTYVDQNIALIPGTTIPIAIDNVNPTSNTQYYVANTGGTTVEYDGFTTVLTAVAPVICDQNYTIKIGVADAGDFSYDSGVFLEAASFSSVGANVSTTGVQTNNSVYTNDSTLYEGCGGIELTITLADVTPVDSMINFTIGGTATNGVDIVNLADSILIPAGLDSVTFLITPIWDGIDEGDETIVLDFPFGGTCSEAEDVQVTIVILDVDSLTLDYKPQDQVLCDPDDFYLYLQASGGVPPNEFQWEWGDTSATGFDLYDTPLTTTTYRFTVTDACLSQQLIDSVTVTILDDVQELQANVNATSITVCEDDPGVFQAAVSGGVGGGESGWFDASGQLINDGVNLEVFEEEGQYEYLFLVTDDCDNRDSVLVSLSVEVCDVTIPNVFTPNGDGFNDYFYIENIEKFENAHFTVVNRWGSVVYENTNYGASCGAVGDTGCWDGTVNNGGSDCAEGTYFYVLRLPNGEEYNGNLTLFRE
jgi:gliding motility-associated-like protein